MARPKVPLSVRVSRLSRLVGGHLIWGGRFKKGRPYLKGVGNPVRVALSLVDHRGFQVRNNCGLEACIEPRHYRVIEESSFRYHDRPKSSWCDPRVRSDNFSDRELEMIELEVQSLIDGEVTEDDVIAVTSNAEMLDEILRRARAAA
ncbi:MULTISPECIES: hypothetical protein [unclassified Mesorhizobium]|uniref:hypothetical protein n=1 Tax=unclassified Mesorhizobium TaxID=325217 RepID=UPI001125EFC3|nr:MULTISPECIES: hypothetical protein [unclassified Mesorhizobium]MBZ9984093.1 hypothetical protein [Mesorhizobium sp. BR-1-1-8]TPL59063.1 hypothetical protein FJ949_27935 [Mesorhizobium sp. B2-4-1]